MRALGGTAGQRTSRPRLHRPLADGLYDSESSEEDPELQAGRLQVATHRLSYDSLTQPDEPTPEETRDVTHTLPHTRNALGVTIYYTGHPTTKRWYTDGLKRHGRAGGGMSNGDFRVAFRVHGPQQVYRVEVASDHGWAAGPGPCMRHPPPPPPPPGVRRTGAFGSQVSVASWPPPGFARYPVGA